MTSQAAENSEGRFLKPNLTFDPDFESEFKKKKKKERYVNDE